MRIMWTRTLWTMRSSQFVMNRRLLAVCECRACGIHAVRRQNRWMRRQPLRLRLNPRPMRNRRHLAVDLRCGSTRNSGPVSGALICPVERRANRNGHIRIRRRVAARDRAACRIAPAVVERHSSGNLCQVASNSIILAERANSSAHRRIPISSPIHPMGRQASRGNIAAAVAMAIAHRSSTGQCVVVASMATPRILISSRVVADIPTSAICARRVIAARLRHLRRMPSNPNAVAH